MLNGTCRELTTLSFGGRDFVLSVPKCILRLLLRCDLHVTCCCVLQTARRNLCWRKGQGPAFSRRHTPGLQTAQVSDRSCLVQIDLYVGALCFCRQVPVFWRSQLVSVFYPEAAGFSETSVPNYQSIRRHSEEDSNLRCVLRTANLTPCSLVQPF